MPYLDSDLGSDSDSGSLVDSFYSDSPDSCCSSDSFSSDPDSFDSFDENVDVNKTPVDLPPVLTNLCRNQMTSYICHCDHDLRTNVIQCYVDDDGWYLPRSQKRWGLYIICAKCGIQHSLFKLGVAYSALMEKE
jgi:hypothetical protein